MCSLVKSAGVVIGWNENLHTLGPPWHMIGHPYSKRSFFFSVSFLTLLLDIIYIFTDWFPNFGYLFGMRNGLRAEAKAIPFQWCD